MTMSDQGGVKIKRIYEAYEETDGYRLLVDRLWPRGVKKAAARISDWSKDLAPSTSLRRWFAHEPEKFAEFRRLYLEELAGNESIEDELRELAAHPTITLLYAAADTTHNHAVILRDFLIQQQSKS